MDSNEVFEGINHKNIRAWEKVYDLYYAALCSYAESIVKDADSAQDIVQETLIKIWNSDHTFSDHKAFTWYLYRAVYNNSLYHLRSLKVRKKAFAQMSQEEEDFTQEQFARTVLEELIRQLYVYLEDLPKDRKEIILLSLKGLSGNEIAETLGISINTVKKQKNRGFRYLREKLDGTIWIFLL